MDTPTAEGFFRSTFFNLTERNPFSWQVRAFFELAQGFIREAYSLPTGTGKTSLMPIWLICLGWQALQGSLDLPRRLVWVVNRRVVVDQATEEAVRILERLSTPKLADFSRLLSGISLSGRYGYAPVALSTLRGQLADNGEWKIDPSRAAIVVGTVDMIGSRLLFSGYGDGKYKRPLHAGLLGQDAWVVLDEAHLTPAFASLLTGINREQKRTQKLMTWRFSFLSATQRDREDRTFTLQPHEKKDKDIQTRLKAKKVLHIHELDVGDDELETIAKLALAHRHERSRVTVFVSSPDSVMKLWQKITKQHNSTAIRVLTGTQRGYERDELARDPVFSGFRSNKERLPPDVTHFLIATAAGEVGADLDADHLVCDFSLLDSLIQRFGRVNRLGMGDARIDLVVASKEDTSGTDDLRRTATLDFLKRLPKSDHAAEAYWPCPANLSEPDPDAFSHTPPILQLTRQCLDAWSLTSIAASRWPGRPDVAPWLHGVVDDLPETWVVWRDDIEWLGDPAQANDKECSKVLNSFQILPLEQLREPTARVRDKLRKLTKLRENASRHAILVGRDGSLIWRGTLRDLVADEAGKRLSFNFCTLLLSTAVGGLSENGILEIRSSTAVDVADCGQGRRRFLAKSEHDSWQAIPIPSKNAEPGYSAASREDLIREIVKGERLRLVASARLGEFQDEPMPEASKGQYLLYFCEPKSIADSDAKSYIGGSPQPLSMHLQLVGRVARELLQYMAHEGNLLAALVEALEIAGFDHDTGKDRACWQRAIGNPDPTSPFAKSLVDRFNPRLNGGYRHEFGSLVSSMGKVRELERDRDLILHLIASHHGNARPHFDQVGYDRESALSTCLDAATQVMKRFGRLQAHYGWWGLAYLEAILKGADVLVSAGLIKGDLI